MDVLAGLMHGFAVLFSPLILAAGVLGLVAGVVAGFLPGLSPAGAIALQFSLLLPMTIGFGVQSPVVFMVAFAYGTLYGRALATINFDALDRADAAPYPKAELPGLIGALIAAIVVAGALGFLVDGSRGFSLQFGPAEMSALVAFVLLGGAAFSRGSAAGALATVVVGLLLSLIGADIETGIPRLTFGIAALEDGLGFVPVALGLFVIANVIDELIRSARPQRPAVPAADSSPWAGLPAAILAALSGLLPTNGETYAASVGARRATPATSLLDPARQRGTAAIIRAAMLSDIRLSVSLIPLLLWLLPIDPITVMMRGAVSVQAAFMGGKNLMANLPPIMWLACATLVAVHVLPLLMTIGFAKIGFAKIVQRPIRIDIRIIAALLLVGCCVAAWQVNNAAADVAVMLVFGLIGYAMIRSGFDRSLMFFAFAVGPNFDENIRRTLLIARGDATIYVQRPICAALLIAGVLIFAVVRVLRHKAAGP